MSAFSPKTSLRHWLRELSVDRYWLARARADARRGGKGKVTHAEAKRIKERAAQVAHDEKMIARRRAQIAAQRSRGEQALEVARSLLHVREVGGNNRGEWVTRIIRANGGVGPEPWCGDFAAYCYRGISKAVGRGWAWVPGLQRIAGLKKHPASTARPKAGWLVVFNFDGGVEDHVGLVDDRKRASASWVPTVEGNTRPGSASSDSGGGEGVYERDRPRSQIAYFLEVTR